MAKKSALGRGLGALIVEADQEPRHQATELTESINEIEIAQIEVNPFQPRKHFDEEALGELAASIRELGIIQPITVRKLDNGRYQLITGERRFRASSLAGLERIPAYVRMADDQSMLELALVENIQREDLDAIEVAISYQRLIEECSLTQESLSERVGKKRSTIANYLRLLKLPAEIQLGIRERKLSMGHARAITSIEDHALQLDVFGQVVSDALSVRQVEEMARAINHPEAVNPLDIKDKESGEKPNPKEEIISNSLYDTYRSRLSNYFNSKVELKSSPKGDGKIIIPFRSEKELEKIISALNNAAE
jgi:ParB family transcriptional regulator, chromosome partitioning protein